MRYRNASRRLATAGLLAVATGLAVTAAPAAAATAGGAEGWASGLTSTGLLKAGPTPEVSSGGSEVRKSLLHPKVGDLVDARALDLQAAKGRGRATAAGVSAPKAKLNASAISADCKDGRGGARLADATLAGKHLESAPPPNTTIPVDVQGLGRAAVTLNKQERLPGKGLRVTGLQIDLPVPKGKKKGSSIRISSVICGPEKGAGTGPGGNGSGGNGPDGNGPDGNGPDGNGGNGSGGNGPSGNDGNGSGGNGPGSGYGSGGAPAAAPKPTPVRHDLPVTG